MTLIHRQESMSLLGFPIVRYIDIDDAEGVLRAINETPPGRAIEIILHTPGGLVIAAQQIASALADHDGHVTAVDPHYAMSGGHPDRAGGRRDRGRHPRGARARRPAAGPVSGRLAGRGREAARRPRGPDADHGRVGARRSRRCEGFTTAAAGAAHAAGTRARRGAPARRPAYGRMTTPAGAASCGRSACPCRSACRSRSVELMEPLPPAARPHARGRVRARPRRRLPAPRAVRGSRRSEARRWSGRRASTPRRRTNDRRARTLVVRTRSVPSCRARHRDARSA